MKPRLVGLFVLCSALAGPGCGGDVTSNPSGSSGSSSGAMSSSSGGLGGESSSSSATSSSSGGGQGAGGAGGAGGATGCAELAPIQLGPGSIMDMNNDGKWVPGESAMVNVVMTNTSNMDINYPGIEVVSSNPKVTSGNPYNALFVLFANQTSELGVGFDADPSVPPGTVVSFTATLHSIMDVSCAELPSLSFTATLQ